MESQGPRIDPEDTKTTQPNQDLQPTPQAKFGDNPETPSEAKATSDEEGPTIESLEPGMELRGRVRNIVDFGAFIDIGVGRDGLPGFPRRGDAGAWHAVAEECPHLVVDGRRRRRPSA